MRMKKRLEKHSLKFIAAALSVILWIYVLNSERVKFEKTVAVDYLVNEGMTFSQKPPTEVIFLIEGPRAFVKSVIDRQDRLIIDFNKINSAGRQNFHADINPNQLNLPFGMVVERVLPRKISISLEKKASKFIPIKLAFSGQLPEDQMFKHLQLSVSEIEVSGPRSILSSIKEIGLRPIEVEGLKRSATIPVEINLPDERLAMVGGHNVSLTYEIGPSSPNWELKDVPIRFLGSSDKVSSKTKVAKLKLFISEKFKKNRLNLMDNIQVWADLPGHKKGKSEVPLKVILPEGVQLIEVIPKTIIVNVR